MSTKFYDVILFGDNLAALVAASLLAARRFTVLHIKRVRMGTSGRKLGGMDRRRRSYLSGIFDAPIAQEVIRELNLGHRVRSTFKPVSPIMQLVDDDVRFAILDQREAQERELAREFPGEAEGGLEQHLADLDEINSTLNQFLSPDLPIFPSGIREGWAFSSKLKELKAAMQSRGDQIARVEAFWQDHPLGRVFRDYESLGGFANQGFDDIFRFRRARSFFRENLYCGDKQCLEVLLEEKLAKGAGALEEVTIQSWNYKQGHHVFQTGNTDFAGKNVLVGFDFFDLPELFEGSKATKFVASQLSRVRPSSLIFKLGFLLQRKVIPLGMESFLLQRKGDHWYIYERDASLPNEAEIERVDVKTAVSLDGLNSEGLHRTIARIRDAARELIPFLDDYLIDLYPDEIRQASSLYGPYSGKELWYDAFDAKAFLAGVPFTLPMKRSYVAGPEVFPELGTEGQLITGHAVARAVCQANPKKV